MFLLDPYPAQLLIRIRIEENDTDPDPGKWYRSGSATFLVLTCPEGDDSYISVSTRDSIPDDDDSSSVAEKATTKRIHTNSIWHNIENIRYAKTQSLKGKYSPYGTFISGCGSCRICLILLELKKWNRKFWNQTRFPLKLIRYRGPIGTYSSGYA